jgi:glycosyltransferase involved in cell wall biosynthesis
MKDLMILNGISEEKIEILPPYFVPIPEIIYRANDQPQNQNAKILFAGRLEYEKGLPYLLRAVADLQLSNQLIVAGDGSLKQNYIKFAHDLGLADNVKFVDWLSASALEELYSDCTISVMPSIMPEPFGKVGVESMANGRPVVAFDVGGISDWLIDGFNGYLVPSRDISLLSQKIGNLLSNQELLNKFGFNGRNHVEVKFSTYIHIQDLFRILSSVIKENK